MPYYEPTMQCMNPAKTRYSNLFNSLTQLSRVYVRSVVNQAIHATTLYPVVDCGQCFV